MARRADNENANGNDLGLSPGGWLRDTESGNGRNRRKQPISGLEPELSEQGFRVENQCQMHTTSYRSQISSLSSVFPSEVYDIRLASGRG